MPDGRLRTKDVVDGRGDAGDVAEAAAFRDKGAAGAQDAGDLSEERGVAGDPVKSGDADDGVHRLAQGQPARDVGVDGLDPVHAPGKAPPKPVEHAQRAVDGHDVPVREEVQQRGGVAAGAAAQVEHALVTAWAGCGEPAERPPPHCSCGSGSAS